jgi:putative endopeptidase
MKKHYLLSAVTLALLANFGHAEGTAGTAAAAKNTAKGAQALSSGVATQYIDPSVRAQDDFYEYLNGKWLKTVEIPADKSRWGSFNELQDKTLPQLRGIIEKSSASNPAKGTDAQRIGDFYASFMDEAKLEQLGVSPLHGELQRIAALKDKSELPALLAHLGKIGVNIPFDFGIHQDNKDSTKYVADIGQGSSPRTRNWPRPWPSTSSTSRRP